MASFFRRQVFLMSSRGASTVGIIAVLLAGICTVISSSRSSGVVIIVRIVLVIVSRVARGCVVWIVVSRRHALSFRASSSFVYGMVLSLRWSAQYLSPIINREKHLALWEFSRVSGWIKINTDGVVNGFPGLAGCGGIFRKHKGFLFRGCL